jgi:hypothetical protein
MYLDHPEIKYLKDSDYLLSKIDEIKSFIAGLGFETEFKSSHYLSEKAFEINFFVSIPLPSQQCTVQS